MKLIPDRINVRVEPKIRKTLYNLAKRKKTTPSVLVRIALSKYLDSEYNIEQLKEIRKFGT
jgi:predicted transcriptional regulator